jgi:hypothetical protein
MNQPDFFQDLMAINIRQLDIRQNNINVGITFKFMNGIISTGNFGNFNT